MLPKLILFHLPSVILLSSATLWEDDEANIENLVKVVDEIEALYPNSRLYGLGSDPGWILEAKKRLRAYMPKKTSSFHHSRHIPFSEGFQEESRRIFKGNYTLVVSKKKPTSERTAHYERLLHELGLNPREIHYQYEEFGRKTVIVEVTSRHRYIATFTRILVNWARRQDVDLRNALKIVTVSAKTDGFAPVEVLFYMKGRLSLTCNNVYVNEKTLGFLREGSKVVPDYPAEGWVEPVPALHTNERVKKIMKKLDRFAETMAASHYVTSTVSGRQVPSLTLRSQSTEGNPSVEYNVPSMSSGWNNDACANLELYTKNRISYNYEDAHPEERYLGIVNEPLHILFTYKTTGLYTINKLWFALNLKWNIRESNFDETFEQFVMDDIADESSTIRGIFNQACAARAIGNNSMILRAPEFDFQIPYSPTAGSVKDPNSFYMIFNYNTTKEDALNIGVLKNLWGLYGMHPRNASFLEYLGQEMSNPKSLAAKYLKRASDRRHNVERKNQDAEVYEEEGLLHQALVTAPLKVLNFLGSSVRTAKGWLGGSFLFDWDYSTHFPQHFLTS